MDGKGKGDRDENREREREEETEFKGVETEVEGAVERQEESPGTVSRIRDVSGAREASPRKLRNEHWYSLVHTLELSLLSLSRS